MEISVMWGVSAVLTVSGVLCVAGRAREHRDAVTTQGAARGYLVPNPPHFTYFGLPYARPPTRRDRFKAPKPPPQWDGIFEATHKIKCVQRHADGEENCLVLNVFMPEHATSLPVLVFVHDGHFQSGWGAHHVPAMFLNERFVVVTFNYRLGALGFLCLRIPEAPGNAGLKDQIAALYWVQQNIAQFGGNPRDVTVYGTGAGAAAVQLILLSGLAKDLIHRVILESGSVLSPSSMVYDPLTIAYNGARSLGYEGPYEPNDLYNFYMNAYAHDLVNMREIFLPCVDNATDYVNSFIEMDPMEKLKEGDFFNVLMLITYTHKDMTSLIGRDMQRFQNPPDTFEYLLPNNLEFEDSTITHKVGEIVKQFYFGEDTTRPNIPETYAAYIHDILTEYPMIKMAMLFAAKNSYSVYLMKFTLLKNTGIDEEFVSASFDSLLDYFYKDKDQSEIITEKLMSLLRNFMKLGDPTPLTTTLIPVIWQPVPSNDVSISDVPLLKFDDNLRMAVPRNNRRLLFWDNIFKRFYKSHTLRQQLTKDMDDND